ncbi:MAG: TonB-dependent receptor [Saprospiraceae bacterium]|nr:TonB-dependent receptor [Saprospiraceae bacterium]
MKKIYIFFGVMWSFCFCINETQAQTPAQTIRGTVLDESNNQPLEGTSIELIDLQQGTITDSNGNFRFDQVPVNRYQLRINYVGRETLVLPILLESGKELVLEITLRATQSSLDTILVKAPRSSVLHPLSTQTITIEETFRYPATFYDPARLVALYPGVANVNNQGNAISVRGNSPNNNIWRLEGVEIVNPNHTPNAGTFSDRITQSSGGVNILSAQMLGYSNFLTGAFPAQYGNVLGGALDMNLRKGNNQQHEFIGQIGLVGIDLAAEGPLNRGAGASYLANYRYSTIGLLSDLGVDVGDEQISFQDASLHLTFPTQKVGAFTLFGIVGQSENIFETSRDSLLWEENKDRFDIFF